MKEVHRRTVLREWRGLPEDRVEPDRTASVRDILKQLAPKLGLEDRLREEEIISTWAAVVGDFFALHSRPIRLQQGVLTVSVLQPTIMYEMDRQFKSVILAKLKKEFGARKIRELRFRIG